MEQLQLGQFKGEVSKEVIDEWASFRDSFDDLKFESGVIKQLNLDEMKLFNFSQQLSCERGLDKQNKLEFIVFTRTFYPDAELETDCVEMGDSNKFKKKELAQEFFYSQKSHLEWNMEVNKENKVFDGRRYVWKTTDNKLNELTGECGWI